ncbi:ParM/StbA family protein [Leptolyngbya sp. NIES-2104]|uniref:ParM/StbA family protein n=1 Tax=Leptolyngbya sp. NIES-2104 TaxID=1552121 RepID=UPI0006ECAB8F|nr:hypothetical protein [Leptolyngbya sp. NIES-2104]GAQ00166.1 actin-like ATPase [Leptolyngbya sp. NIES-2104]
MTFMTKNLPKVGQNAASDDTTRQTLAIGLDVGNGAEKLYSGLGQILQESYVLYLEERATFANQGYVEYLDGNRSDLMGRQWIGGINAYYSHPTAIYRVTDSKEGKTDLCLQLFLSALTQFPHRSDWFFNIVASVHDGATFGKAIAQALSGTHRIRLLGKESTVNIIVGKVLEEGAGTAYAIRHDYDFTNALLFDIGNGTTIVSSFNNLQMTYRDYAPDAGVEKLIDAIALSESVRQFLKRPADRHLIRAGIESGRFEYGTQCPDWNFREAYLKALPEWFNQGLKPFVRAAEARVPAATAIVAVGGGACLPGIPQLLAKRGISVPQNARWTNAKGLYEIALRLSARS